MYNKLLNFSIGNGKKAKVWEDAWLSTSAKTQPFGPATEATRHWTVSDLFLPETSQWDENIIDNLLPVGMNLARRGGLTSSLCNRCEAPETIKHLLFECPYATQTWNLAPFDIPIDLQLIQHTDDGLLQAKSRYTLPPVGLGPGILHPWICWFLWLSRNQLIFKDKSFSPSELMTKAIISAKEWANAQSTAISLGRKDAPPTVTPTTGDTIVCQTDGAWKAELNAAGFGGVFLRNDIPVDEFAASSSFVSSPLIAEALAIRLALIRAKELNYERVVVLSDSLQMVRSIDAGEPISAAHGILSDISILSSSFVSFSLLFIPRSANVLADTVAKRALMTL